MELPGGGDEWLAPSPSPSGPAVPDRHDEHGVGTFIWPPVDTSTWPPVGTFSWPRTRPGAILGRIERVPEPYRQHSKSLPHSQYGPIGEPFRLVVGSGPPVLKIRTSVGSSPTGGTGKVLVTAILRLAVGPGWPVLPAFYRRVPGLPRRRPRQDGPASTDSAAAFCGAPVSEVRSTVASCQW